MKRIILFLFLSIVIFQAYSQTNDSIVVVKSPAGRLSGLIDIQDLVNEGFNYWSEEFKGHWSGVELGFNGFANSDYSLYPYNENNFLRNTILQSNILNINLLQYSKGIQQTRNTIGLVTGLALSIQSYRLNNHTSIVIDENRKVQPLYRYFESNQKSKLSSVYLEVPLLVEFQIPLGYAANRMYFSVGITGAKRIESHTKVKYRKDNKREKLKSPGDYSIQDYKVSASFRVGYRWINLFTTYDIVPLFENRRGPVLYPFSVGLRLISF
ncbi:MAG: hypothetical protein Q8N05_07975 [Bacteroidota bacterium]|nr:hypothetical protein [Bacteroidota bacterium]